MLSQECLICLEKINSESYIMFLNDEEAKCSCMKNNKIHMICFKQWVKNKDNKLLCPICINSLSYENILLHDTNKISHIDTILNESTIQIDNGNVNENHEAISNEQNNIGNNIIISNANNIIQRDDIRENLLINRINTSRNKIIIRGMCMCASTLGGIIVTYVLLTRMLLSIK